MTSNTRYGPVPGCRIHRRDFENQSYAADGAVDDSIGANVIEVRAYAFIDSRDRPASEMPSQIPRRRVATAGFMFIGALVFRSLCLSEETRRARGLVARSAASAAA